MHADSNVQFPLTKNQWPSGIGRSGQIVLVLLLSALYVNASPRDCARTAHLQVYSNAFFSEETGDVNGYELAISQRNGSKVDALLYVYEGAPNDEGIHVSGHFSGKVLAIEGEWVEHLIEYPSKKEVVQKHHVKIDGTLDSASFRGTITVEGLATSSVVRLNRVGYIWVCNPKRKP